MPPGEQGIRVVTASVDTEGVARRTIEENNVSFPVGCGFDPAYISEVTGAFYQDDPGVRGKPFLHTTDFLLQPDGVVNVAAYSTGPIGRFIWQDVVQAVQFRKEKMAAAKAK